MTRYIFLDIDGVLNDEQEVHANGIHGTDPVLVDRLNQIIDATDPKIVVTSSWRKDVHRGHMTLTGFERMLMRHGINCGYRLVGITEPDACAISRGELINMWLDQHAGTGFRRYVVLDDGSYWVPGQRDHGIHAAGHTNYFIHTNYRLGLTDDDVSLAIKILGRKRVSVHQRWLKQL